MDGIDFTFTSPQTVTFATDVSEATVALYVADPDTVYTGDRTFQLQLENAVGGPTTSGKDLLEFTIIDDGILLLLLLLLLLPLLLLLLLLLLIIIIVYSDLQPDD